MSACVNVWAHSGDGVGLLLSQVPDYANGSVTPECSFATPGNPPKWKGAIPAAMGVVNVGRC